ncbi:TPA: TetR/AcrR family transcriptional regulator, partial [Elizabethkingia anophelis]
FDFLMYMNDKEDFRGCSFLNISSEILDNKIQIHNTIRQHKNLLRNFFTKEIPDEILADHIYLLFEGSIMMGRLYRNNELIIKSKTIIDSLLKD